MNNQEWKPNTRAYIERWLDEAAQSGEIDLRAKRLGISYSDAVVSLAEELEKPYKEIEEKYARRRAQIGSAVTEEELDRKASEYARRHGVDYAVALDAVLGGSSPGAASRPVVELEEEAPERPRVVDEADAAFDRRAKEYARRHGVSYGVAFDAVLEGEERA